MTGSSRFDAWQAGDSYDMYMGRWSRRIAPDFLKWLDMPDGLDWLDIGCGTGALSAAILASCNPRSLLAIDPSEGFVAKARHSLGNSRASVEVGDAQSLAVETASRDIIVSALVLNFIPDRIKALAEMKRVARPGATIAIYVWDYPGRGVEFMRAFWDAATALDPKAQDLTEDKRFPFCTIDGLADLAKTAGLNLTGSTTIEKSTVFKDFEDYWRPFTLGAGPAPGYCTSLDLMARERLKQKLHDTLTRQADGSIRMQTRAWAIRATPG